ncbi:nitrate/sulfonate/bicarbonate ABC transporter ATP-binding protein (plasmid) [Deltaproteobacteria bacterium Smac51]|nr:nitrate/sulfonate/bicarbonate ABC transporter ATP-binding protein [Deltaproteobacteria bacterium Smac51]
MSEPVLVIQGLGKTFRKAAKATQAVQALDSVSFSVDEGEYVCLLGRSGCGKSTLLGILAGLIAPDEGLALCRGTSIQGPDRHRMLMFQEAALFPWLNVFNNVLYSLKFVHELSKGQKCERAESFLDLVGLADYHHFRIHELSGGMRQRVALARALAPDPDILLMDEPFSALDAMTREQLYTDMQRIWRTTNKTILMVTHNVREAVCLGTRVLVMERPGRVIADEKVLLPYPRAMNDTALVRAAADISGHLQKTDEHGQEKAG